MKIEELRKIQKAATPGPWIFEDTSDMHHGLRHEIIKPKSEASWCSAQTWHHRDGLFTATFNPSLIAKLLDVVEAAEFAYDQWNTYKDKGMTSLGRALKNLEESDG